MSIATQAPTETRPWRHYELRKVQVGPGDLRFFPSFSQWRDGWKYLTWSDRENWPIGETTFEEMSERSLRSDHGEERATDIYPEGMTHWVREQPKDK